ncbi:MAG TPA: autotransporter outer membrane beta-barrel domain-containing protein [Pararobbsia sp.]|nr:autotransporter outer membrane beta-barrel domain-containing protein [Pararobbsia sp.]
MPGRANAFGSTQTLRITNDTTHVTPGSHSGTLIAAAGGLDIVRSDVRVDAILVGSDSVAGTTPANPSATIAGSAIWVDDVVGGITVGEGTLSISDASVIHGDVTAGNNGAYADSWLGSGHLRVTDSVLVGTVQTSFRSSAEIDGSVIGPAGGRNAAIRIRGGGNVSVRHGSSVKGGTGIRVEGDPRHAPGRVTIDNAQVEGTQGAAIWMSGDTLGPGVISRMAMPAPPGVSIETRAAHGGVSVDNRADSGGPASSGQTIDVINGATLTGSTGEMLRVESAFSDAVHFHAANVDLHGDLVAQAGSGPLDVTMTQTGNITGAMTGVASLSVSDSTWTLTNDSRVERIESTRGAIHTGSHSLETSSLAGHGTIVATSERAGKGPALKVTQAMSGEWSVSVKDTRHNYAPGELQPMYLVADVGGANTAQVSGRSDIGAYRYLSRVDANGDVIMTRDTTHEDITGPGDTGEESDDNQGAQGDGGVTGDDDTGEQGTADPGSGSPNGTPMLNSGANAAVDAMSAAASRAIWDTQFSALHLRQQHLRDFMPEPGAGSFWAQGYGGDYKLDNGYGSGHDDRFDATVTGVSIGFDKVLRHTDAADVAGGVYASFVDENRSAELSRGDAHGYSIGAYGTWRHRSGAYVEGMMAFGQFSNDFTARYAGDPARSTVNAKDWSSSSGALAIEMGRRFELEEGWSVQPAVGLRYLHQAAQQFATDRGHEVRSDGMNATGVNASVTFARSIRDHAATYRPYLRLGYAKEFNGTQTVHYAGASINTALGASRLFVNTGIEASISRRHAMYLDYQYQKGRNVENTYLLNVGYRYAF